MCFCHRRPRSSVCVRGLERDDADGLFVSRDNTNVGFDIRNPFRVYADVVASSIYSLNVAEPSEVTLDLLHQFEYDAFTVDVVDLGPRVIVIQGRVGSEVGADWRLVALDVHTRMQLLLPSFTHATWEAAEVRRTLLIHVRPKSHIQRRIDARMDVDRGDHLAHEDLNVDAPHPSQVLLHPSRRLVHVPPGIHTSRSKRPQPFRPSLDPSPSFTQRYHLRHQRTR